MPDSHSDVGTCRASALIQKRALWVVGKEGAGCQGCLELWQDGDRWKWVGSSAALPLGAGTNCARGGLRLVETKRQAGRCPGMSRFSLAIVALSFALLIGAFVLTVFTF
jgi:hypothetical protein